MFIPFFDGTAANPRDLYATIGPNPGSDSNFYYQSSVDELNVENIHTYDKITVDGSVDIDSSTATINLVDNAKLFFGTGDDFEMYFDGSDMNAAFNNSNFTLNFRNTTDNVTASLSGEGNLVVNDITVNGTVTGIDSGPSGGFDVSVEDENYWTVAAGSMTFTTAGAVSGLSLTDTVPTGTPIVTTNGSGTGARSLEYTIPINFVGSDKLVFWSNKGGSGWGDSPEAGEDLKLYARNAGDTSWIDLGVIAAFGDASNVWYKKELEIATLQTIASTAVIFDSPAGVEIKIQQDSASGDNFDNWAFTGFTVAPAGGGGGLDPTTAIQLNDNVNLELGTGSDYDLFFDGSHLNFDTSNDSHDIKFGVSGSAKFTMNMGNGDFTATGDFISESDARVKENVQTIENALDKVNAMRGVTFTKINSDDGRTHAGVIAQEVEAVLPEVVSEKDDGMKSVSYGNMVGLLIEAIKELKEEVEDLKSE
tara:strand:- start:56 stop:1489 length:1434 start_codon:yes stop_codon:yes gene_type:complete